MPKNTKFFVEVVFHPKLGSSFVINYGEKERLMVKDIFLRYWYTYLRTCIFLCLVYSPTSYENIKNKWFPEIHHHMPNVPILLVGTKMDLRNNEEVISRLRQEGKAPITTADGNRLAAELGAVGYLECSALTQQGLKTVFDNAIKNALEAMDRPVTQNKNKKCIIM